MPTQRTDGSRLENLLGYRIYSGTDPDKLRSTIEICTPSATSWVVTGLSSGTWYFALTAVDADDVESDRTQVVSREIR